MVMISSLFAETLQPKLQIVQKIARNAALTLSLIGLVLPISYLAVTANTENPPTINSNTKVTVEIVNKNDTKTVRQMTVQELQTDSELDNLKTFEAEKVKQTQLELTPEKIQEIENRKGIIYDNQVAVVKREVLLILGYTPQQVDVIQEMVDFYNSQTIKSVKFNFDGDKIAKSKSNFFTVQTQAAACEKEIRHDSNHWWGVRYFMNDCMVRYINQLSDLQDLLPFLGVIKFCNPIVCGYIAFNILLQKWIMNWRNSECGEAGVYFDVEWLGDVYFTKIC